MSHTVLRFADEFVLQRADAVRAAMRGAGSGNSPLPAVLVENSSRCDKNDDGESVLPGGVAWLPALMQEVRPNASHAWHQLTVLMLSKSISGYITRRRGYTCRL